MVDMRMLAHRPVLLTNVATLVSGFALFSCFVLVPTFVQAPPRAATASARPRRRPGSTCCRARSRCSSPARGGTARPPVRLKWPLAGGMLIVSLAALVLARAHDEPWHVVAASGALGVGVGAAFAAMVALISENVDATEMGVATGMNTVVRMIGAVVGGQVGAALLTAQTIGDTSAPAESAFTTTFALSAGAALAAALVALAIVRRPLRRLVPARAPVVLPDGAGSFARRTSRSVPDGRAIRARPADAREALRGARSSHPPRRWRD